MFMRIDEIKREQMRNKQKLATLLFVLGSASVLIFDTFKNWRLQVFFIVLGIMLLVPAILFSIQIVRSRK